MRSTPRVVVAVLVAATLLAVVASPVVAARPVVVGEPDLAVSVPDNRVAPGDERTLSLVLSNRGDLTNGGPERFEERVTTARGIIVSVGDGGGPIDVRTADQPIGSLAVGETASAPVDVVVSDDAPPGTYRLPVTVRYVHTRTVRYSDPEDPRYVDRERTERFHITVVVEERPQFTVVESSTDLQVGNTGTVTLGLRNRGPTVARDAVVTVRSPDPDLTFGNGATTAESYVGTWERGRTHRLSFETALSANATTREYAVVARVNYSSVDNLRRQSDPLRAGIRPFTKQQFGLENVSGDLRVAEDGTVEGALRNEGPLAVRDATLVVHSAPDGVQFDERTFLLGDLPVSERADFSMPVTVTNATDAGPKRVAFTVRYRSGGDDAVQSTGPLDTRVTVGPSRDQFVVTPLDAVFEVDSDGVLRLRVQNNGDDPVTSVDVALGVTDPFESDDTRAYVPRLDPGDSANVSFDLRVTNDAIAKIAPVDVSMTYTDVDGRTRTAGPYRVPVEVIAPRNPLPVVPALVVTGGIVVAATWWWLRQRR